MRISILLTAALVLLLLILGVRLFWTASKTETGWTTLRQQWRDAAVGFILGDQIPIQKWKPVDQANFWLQETKRITALEPDNAELAMGAAIVLESIDWGYEYSDVERLSDRECRSQSLTMTSRATEIQQANACWWRLRALLQAPIFQFELYLVSQECKADWLNTIEQCIIHDPDNALYDYLAAWQLFYDSTEDGFTIITDKQKYAKAIYYWQKGLKNQPILGTDASSAVRSFLSRSIADCFDENDIAATREITSRFESVAYHLMDIQIRRAQDMERQGDIIGAVILLQETLFMLDQFSQLDEIALSDSLRNKILTLTELNLIAQVHSNLFTPEELDAIQFEMDHAKLEGKVLDKAKNLVAFRLIVQSEPWSAIAIFLFTKITLYTMLPLLFVALFCMIAGKYIKRDRERPAGIMGLQRHVIIWLACYILTYVVLGMTAANIIPPITQGWSLTILTFFAFIALMIWLIWRFVYFRKFQFTIRSLLILTFIIAFCCGILKISDCNLFILADIKILDLIAFLTFAIILWLLWRGVYLRKSRYTIRSLLALTFLIALCWGLLEFAIYDLRNLKHLYLSKRNWYGSDTEWLQFYSIGKWFWALVQWIAYSGHYISIVVAMSLLAFWYNIRFSCIAHQTPDRSRARWIGFFTCLSRSLFVVAFLWMIIYLSISPSRIQIAEAHYQSDKADIMNPNKYNDLINAAIAEVRADKKWMDSIQADNP
jgi:hypothetical protein